ncbi:uncharacterized protein BDR25DRAFT_286446 [Lindgomyces ingoldianus]|uniref:Uncharacterized protein n=1 Tax=Lindgomyces ingoldianus TaxID=673940 RepID=A0ACB6QVK9_9PLEO|nr:uncharacterized protein BDR25DRAFT_286446 [Lindgomyces ingoldianus]KAF2471054.1 hypothetical protein BDR25DRAFT_286446 [Lindgomyces ingoldianus]
MAHTLSSDEYLEVARAHYKKSRYEQAAQNFTRAIELAVIPRLEALEGRSKSFDKLERFVAACKDGRDMIKLDERDIRGYLRTGTELEKLSKPDKAVGIYALGMKKVPVYNKDFMILQARHDRLIRQLSPAHAIDPFVILPVELVDMVFDYMSFKDMVSCLRVCKFWKKFLINSTKRWIHLDFSEASRKCQVSSRFVRSALFRSQNQVQSLVVNRFGSYDVLRTMATLCKGLTEITLLSGGATSNSIIEFAQIAMNLKKLIVHVDISLDTVTQVLRRRPTLVHAEFRSIISARLGAANWSETYPQLNTLLLHWGPGHVIPPPTGIEDVFLLVPLTHLVLKHVHFTTFPRLPPSLEQLVFHPLQLMSLKDPENVLASHLPTLTSLSIANCMDLEPRFFSDLLDYYVPESQETPIPVPSSSLLQALSIKDSLTSSTFFGSEGLLASPRITSPVLHTLDLSTQSCTDDDVEMLVAQLAGLETINLSQTKITGAGVKILVDQLPKLRELNLDDCDRISSQDAANYARKRGIRVSHKMRPTVRVGGRRVRYG